MTRQWKQKQKQLAAAVAATELSSIDLDHMLASA